MNLSKRQIIFFSLFLIGIIHWYLFLNLGEPTFKTFDWNHTHQVHDTIKQSVKELKIPYHATMFDVPNRDAITGEIISEDKIYESINGSKSIRWLAHGHPHVSPHLILLSYFDVPTMMTLNVMIFFSIGFWGILLWIKKLNLSIPASMFLFSIWSFNGYIVSKIGVGHLGSTHAYLYAPMFCWLIYQFIQRQDLHWKENVRNVILFSLFIFFVKLNANGQNVQQFLLVGSVIILFYPRQWLWYAGAMALSLLLMTFYIVPHAMFSPYVILGERLMQGGYGWGPFEIISLPLGLEKIAYHILNIIYHVWSSLIISFDASFDLNWEFNLYVSLFGFILLFCCSAAFFIKSHRTKSPLNLRIFFAFCIISILSLSHISAEIYNNLIVKYIYEIPLLDRLPSRLALYPLSLVFLIAALGFDYFFQIFPSKIRELTKYISIIILLYFLLSHSYDWFVISTELYEFGDSMSDMRKFYKTNILDMPGDEPYISIANISYLVSSITALISLSVLFLVRTKKHHI